MPFWFLGPSSVEVQIYQIWLDFAIPFELLVSYIGSQLVPDLLLAH